MNVKGRISGWLRAGAALLAIAGCWPCRDAGRSLHAGRTV